MHQNQGLCRSGTSGAQDDGNSGALAVRVQCKENYVQETRQDKLNRYLSKKKLRVWKKKVSYANRQKIANDRERVKGRFASAKK